ncbi:MAG: MarR family transcriptional regulator [Candidatus Omnitrophica bacterium]|nr:MarR family transcriptional regulator [Candidatus Omnitrophota bacterium]
MKPVNAAKINYPNDLIVYTIGRLYVLLDSYLYNTAYKEYNLNPSKFNLLMVIKHVGKENGISQSELGSNLYVTAANITKLLDALEKEELVKRMASPDDRRVNLIKITEKGSGLLDDIWPKHVATLNKILENFSAADKEKLNQLLKEFRNDMEAKTK